MLDLRSAEEIGGVVLALAELSHLLARFLGGHDGEHAGCCFRLGEVHRGDAPLGDRGANDIAIGGVLDPQMMLVGVRRGTGGLGRTVDPVERLADDYQAVDRVGARRRVELHAPLASFMAAASVRSTSGTLKALSWVGLAPASSRAVTAFAPCG